MYVLSPPHPLFSTAPQSFFVNETTATPILLNNITCAGTETRLTDCPHGGVGTLNCSHTHDVAVSCPGAYCYIMYTLSCRMRIEHICAQHIWYLHGPTWSCFSHFQTESNYMLLAYRCKIYIFCFQCMQICNHTYCLLMEIMVPFTVLTWMEVAFSS